MSGDLLLLEDRTPVLPQCVVKLFLVRIGFTFECSVFLEVSTLIGDHDRGNSVLLAVLANHVDLVVHEASMLLDVLQHRV